MGKLQIHYHATPQENAEFVQSVAAQAELAVAASRSHHPLALVGADDWKGLATGPVEFHLAPSETAALKETDAWDVCVVRSGRLDGDALTESTLGVSWTSDANSAVWRAVKKALEERLQFGAEVKGPTGAITRAPRHGFSVGALAMAKRGANLRSLTGAATFAPLG